MSFSFTALNTFGNQTLTFTDNRPANVLFDWPTARDINTTVLSGTFTAQRQINIVEIIQPATANVEYHIDVSAVSGTTVNWSTLPSGVSVSSVAGVYIVQGIDSVDDWTAVAAPTITTPVTFNGSFIYTSSIKYTTPQGRQSKSWNVGTFVPVSKMPVVSTLTATAKRFRDAQPSLLAVYSISATLEESGLTSTTATDWTASTTQDIDNNPIVSYDDDDGSSWTVTLTADNTDSISSLSTSGTGGTSVYTSGTKTLTLTGTITQVNTHLNTISFVATSTKQDFTFQYTAESTAQSTGQFTRNQTANCLNLDYLGPLRGTPTYQTAASSVIGTSLPVIADIDYTGSGEYTYTITPNNPAQVATITDSGVVQYWEENVSNATRNIGNVAGIVNNGTTDYLLIGDVTEGINIHYKDGNNQWSESQRLENTATDPSFGRYIWFGTDSAASFMSSDAGNTNNPQSGVQNLYNVFLYRWGTTNFTLKRAFNMPTADGSEMYEWGQWCAMSKDGSKVAILWEQITGTPDYQSIKLYSETSADTWTEEDTLVTSSAFVSQNFCFSPDGDWFVLLEDGTTNLKIYDTSADTFTLDNTVTLPGVAGDYADGSITINTNNHIFVGAPYHNSNEGRIISFNTSGTQLDVFANPDSATANRFGAFGKDPDGNPEYKSRTEIKFNNAGTQFTSQGFVINVDANGDMTQDTDGSWVDYNLVPFNTTIDKFFTFTSSTTDLFEYYEHANPQQYSSGEFVMTGTKTELNTNLDTVAITSASGETGNIDLVIDLLTPETNTEQKTITAVNSGS